MLKGNENQSGKLSKAEIFYLVPSISKVKNLPLMHVLYVELLQGTQCSILIQLIEWEVHVKKFDFQKKNFRNVEASCRKE